MHRRRHLTGRTGSRESRRTSHVCLQPEVVDARIGEAGARSRRLRRAPFALIVLGIAALIASSVAVLVACGPFLTDLIAVNNREPAFREAYSRGDLGVVKPRFYPRYLLQAYRVFNGRAAVRGGALRPWEG